jgi:hypothetical protein
MINLNLKINQVYDKLIAIKIKLDTLCKENKKVNKAHSK